MRLLCVTGNREGTAWELRGCAAGPGPLLSRLPSPACLAGAEPLSLLFTHVSQSQPGTLGQGEQMHRGSLGRALHIFPMAIHIQYVSGRQHW